MDASKTFDKISFWLSFQKLVDKGFPTFIIKILAFWYIHQKMHVRWGTTATTPFLVSNGVKQGDIISPMLINVYMDDISIKLNQSGIGRNIGGHLINHLCYDDLCLISLSSAGMQKLLDMCSTYAIDHLLTYKGCKSFPCISSPNISNFMHYVFI